MTRTRIRPSLSALTALGLLALAGTACTPIVATRGNMADPERLAEIKPGASRQEDVAGLLGTPSHVGTFDQSVWYYIGQKTEKTAFFQPEVVERRVVVVQFDQQGVVTAMKTLDASQGQDVEMVDRVTPTSGRELGFLEQLVGNVGRFGSKGGGLTGPGSPTGTTRRP